MTNIQDMGKGFIPSDKPINAINYSDAVFGAPNIPFNWITGFDLSRTIPLSVDSQGSSSSCVGQSWRKLAEILEYQETGFYTRLSAEFIYSRIWIAPDGGAYGFEGGNVLKNLGTPKETTTPSYDHGNPPSELFMRIKDNRLSTLAEAQTYKARSASYVDTNMESFARAIRDQDGMVMGVIGTNPGWSEMGGGFVRPPKVGETVWGHFVTCVGAVMIAGKKYIKVLNSWGINAGANGYYYIGEDYFAGWVSVGLTLVDLPNTPMTFEAVKVAGFPEVGKEDVFLVRDGKRTLVHDASAFSIVGDWAQIKEISKAELDAIPKSGFELATLSDN